MHSFTICAGRLTLAAEPAHAQLSQFYLNSTCDVQCKMCDSAYQALSQLVQQWERPGDEANINNVRGLTGGGKLHFKHLPSLMAGELISSHQYWTHFTSSSSTRTVTR